jgi:DNA-binding NtrC family response regulator
MQQAQILAYGMDSGQAARIQERVQAEGLWLREVQHLRACRSLLRRGGPAVVVVVLGRDVVQELTLVQQVGQAFPDTAVIVIGDIDHPALAALAWDLGARCVLQPPLSSEPLPELVLRLLRAGER